MGFSFGWDIRIQRNLSPDKTKMPQTQKSHIFGENSNFLVFMGLRFDDFGSWDLGVPTQPNPTFFFGKNVCLLGNLYATSLCVQRH